MSQKSLGNIGKTAKGANASSVRPKSGLINMKSMSNLHSDDQKDNATFLRRVSSMVRTKYDKPVKEEKIKPL
jgi:hypothetical protein